MKKFGFQAMATTTAFLLVLAGGTAYAFPGQGNSCSNCHNNGEGSLAPPADPINVLVGGSELLTFDVETLPAPDGNNMIAITNLTQPELDASIGAGGDNWTFAEFSKSDQGISTGAYSLALDIGQAAVKGVYDLTWYLAGPGPAGAFGTFSVNVIPEPASLALLCFGFTGMAVSSRRGRWQRGRRQK